MSALWQRLMPRERLALLLAGLMLGLVAVQQWVWAPVKQGLVQAQATRERLEQDYAWMQQAAAEIAAYRDAGNTGDADRQPRRSLLVEVDESLKQAGLSDALQDIRPDGTRLLRVELKDVEFDRVPEWLDDLRGQGIEVSSAEIERLGDTSRVDMRLTLERESDQ